MDIDESLAKIKQKQNEFPIWDDVQNADMNSLRTRMDMLSSCLLNGTLRLPDLFYILLRNLDRICYNEVETLIRDILEKSPVLISQTTSRGDNLLHIIARMHRDFEIDPDVPQPLLYLIKQCYERVEHEVYFSPWRMKNREGNTPLHEALLCAAPKARAIISFLISCDASVAAYVNNQTETPLHVLCGSQGKFQLYSWNINPFFIEYKTIHVTSRHQFELLVELVLRFQTFRFNRKFIVYSYLL